MQPNFSPNTVNQTVDFGGKKWRGQPGGGWQDITIESQAADAQKAYEQKSQQAIAGLQTQKQSLPDQYAELLKTVKGQYDPLVNQTTATAQSALAKRGLTPDSQLYQTQVQGALQPVYGAQAANAQQIGQGSVSDMNTLAQAIASAQLGAAQTGAQLPLQYGQLSLSQQALPSQIALSQAQGQYYSGLNTTNLALERLRNQFQNVPAGNSLVNTLANFAINPSLLTQLGGGAANLRTLIP